MLMVKLRFRRWAPSLVPIFEEQFCLAIAGTAEQGEKWEG